MSLCLVEGGIGDVLLQSKADAHYCTTHPVDSRCQEARLVPTQQSSHSKMDLDRLRRPTERVASASRGDGPLCRSRPEQVACTPPPGETSEPYSHRSSSQEWCAVLDDDWKRGSIQVFAVIRFLVWETAVTRTRTIFVDRRSRRHRCRHCRRAWSSPLENGDPGGPVSLNFNAMTSIPSE